MDEFELIAAMLAEQPAARADVRVGPGDDCAVLACPPGCEIALSTDSLVAGRHFLEATRPDVVGYRALAVNLSDLAAMGAAPAWYAVALTAPELEPSWACAFARGLAAAATEAGITLTGGNVARGPLAVTITVLGSLPSGAALLRRGAEPGDRVLVSGRLGEAAMGLAALEAQPRRVSTITLASRAALEPAVARYLLPRARVELGVALRGIASACIDLSDGLAADLAHLCHVSGVASTLQWPALPVTACAPSTALTGGDDYELCFTVPSTRVEAAYAAARGCGVTVTEVGSITAGSGVRCLDADGAEIPLAVAGFRHFE